MDAYFRKMGYHWSADASSATPRLRRMAEEKAKAQRQARGGAPRALAQGVRQQVGPQAARQQAWEQEEGGFNRRPLPKKRR